MSSGVNYGCGCASSRSGEINTIRPCAVHRQHPAFQAALQAQERACQQMRAAMVAAHNDVSPMQIEQAERAASGERYR